MEQRQRIRGFIEKQVERGVKRNEIARSLFFRGYSEKQVGEIMEISPKSAHAMKIAFGRNGKARKDIRDYLRGNAIREFNPFFRDAKALAGEPRNI